VTGFAAVHLMLFVSLGAGCRARADSAVAAPPDPPNAAGRPNEAPVPLDPEPAIDYPAALASHRIGGTVLLRLFVDTAGRVVAESTRVQESSGYPALDSAALKAGPGLRYAPALRNGAPVAAAFLQPLNFRAR
jgi:protein TonB